jgi:hypothetical protein
MKKYLITAAALVTAGLIAGCGGSGSSAGTSTTAVTGKVADGYLANATVFLDKNLNYQLDAGEPSTTTDANGAYTLNVDPADLGKYPIVALAIKGVTKDLDNPDPTATLTNSYLLSLPKDSVSGTVSTNFISPMSTQLREMMETGQYATVGLAMEALRVKLGMPGGTNMLGDYVSGVNKNGSMHTAAQNMAALMGAQMSQVLAGSGNATSVDVNRYRGMMGTIFGNISSVKVSNVQTATMTDLMNSMTATLGTIKAGQPYRNMSSSFRRMGGGMMGR